MASQPGRVVGVDTIVDELWGDDPPPTAVKMVQSHVLRLRRSLRDADGQVIETAPGGYRLAVDRLAVDAGRFEDLVREGMQARHVGDHAAAQECLTAALELWRGPAYLEFRDTQFGAAEGVRLEELFFTAREELGAAQIASGSAAPAVAGLERLVHDSPGREPAWQLLMKALYAAGRQHDALNAFQRARRALSEFGLEPGAELCETEQRILERHPALAPVSGPTMLAAALRTSSALIGRAEQRRELARAWQTAKSGTGQVRIVTGPLESGRTRLTADLAGRAIAEGGSVDYVRGDELLTMLEGADRRDWSKPDSGRIVDAIAERCRSRPYLLIVDDAEWTTGPAVDALRAIAAGADQVALLMVIVIDPMGGGPAVTALGRLDPTGAATITVDALSADELAAVITADGVDPSAVPAIVAMSNGLPGVARREAAIWTERTASERLRAAAVSSIGASAIAQRAKASVLDEVVELVEARARRDELWSARWAGRQPYRALSTYGPQDAELFVGRERFVAELAARVLERRLVVVVGASGSGKSSLLRAGLVPLARSGRLPGSGPWATHVIVPGFDPVASVNAIDELDEPGPRLLVVDQFEEAFAASPATIERFGSQLLDLAGDPNLDVHVVLVVRSDEYAKLAALPMLGEPASQAPVVVGPPTDDEIRRIVAEPARRTGATVEPALVDLVANDVGGYEAALPLVSAAMAEVWERRDAGVMRCERYVELGGLATVVERLGAHALTDAGDQHVDSVRQILLMLADITEDGVWTRRRVPVQELPEDAAALESLVSSRLVVRTDETVEITHEVVFRAWPQLAAWLEEARSDLILERELRSAARVWDVDGRPEDNLYRGTRLQAALEWAGRYTDPIAPAVNEFLLAGRQLSERHEHEIREQLQREQRARRRVTRALGAAAVLLVMALVAGVAAVISRTNAQDARDSARHQALVGASVGLRDSKRQLAALLAVEAHRITPSAATEDALFGLFTRFPGIGRTVTLEGGPLVRNFGFVLPDGETLVSSDEYGVVRLIDIPTGKDRALLGEGFDELIGAPNFAVTPDGRFLAAAIIHRADEPMSGGADLSTLTVWDLSTETTVFDTVHAPVMAGSVAIDPDASHVVVAGGQDGRTLVYDGKTGALVRELPALARPEDAQFEWNTVGLDFMTDGQLVVTSQAGPIRFFDLQTGSETARIDGVPQTGEASVIVSEDGRSMVTMGARGLMRYELPDGAWMWREPSDRFCQEGFAYVPALNVVLCGDQGGRLFSVDLDTGAVVGRNFESQLSGTQPLAGADGKTVLALNSTGYTTWRFDGNGLVNRIIPETTAGLVGSYSIDGRRLMASADEVAPWLSLEVIDLSDDTVVDRLDEYVDAVLAPWSDATVVRFDDGSFGWYDLATRSVVGTHVHPGFDAEGIEALEHQAIMWRNDGAVAILDFDRGTTTRLPDIKPGISIMRITDKDHVVTQTSDGKMQIRDHSMTVVAEIQGRMLTEEGFVSPAIREVTTTPNVIVRTSFDGVLDVVDASSLREIKTLPATGRTINAMAIDGDGRRLLALGDDHALRLYDLETGAQIGGDIQIGDKEANYGALRRDGLEAAVATDQGFAIWNLDPEAWIVGACELAGRNLTREEWNTYVGDLAPYRKTCPQFP